MLPKETLQFSDPILPPSNAYVIYECYLRQPGGYESNWQQGSSVGPMKQKVGMKKRIKKPCQGNLLWGIDMKTVRGYFNFFTYVSDLILPYYIL